MLPDCRMPAFSVRSHDRRRDQVRGWASGRTGSCDVRCTRSSRSRIPRHRPCCRYSPGTAGRRAPRVELLVGDRPVLTRRVDTGVGHVVRVGESHGRYLSRSGCHGGAPPLPDLHDLGVLLRQSFQVLLDERVILDHHPLALRQFPKPRALGRDARNAGDVIQRLLSFRRGRVVPPELCEGWGLFESFIKWKRPWGSAASGLTCAMAIGRAAPFQREHVDADTDGELSRQDARAHVAEPRQHLRLLVPHQRGQERCDLFLHPSRGWQGTPRATANAVWRYAPSTSDSKDRHNSFGASEALTSLVL